MNDRLKVLICIDGSENSLRAVEFARDMLISTDAYFSLLVVVTPLDCDYFMEKTAPVCDVDGISKAKSRAAVCLMEEAGAQYCLMTLTGVPAEVILKQSARHSLVIMGRKGSAASPKVTLGGVAGQVSQNINVPLVLVP
ncbi:MAG: universal stress protein [Methanomassiliicoccales archaeon]|nr:universal stress protein [Methanomassiliicoccales archaeon]